MRFGLFMIALQLGGCANTPDLHWTKPGGTRAEFNRAKAECERMAQREYDCMQLKGFRLEADSQ